MKEREVAIKNLIVKEGYLNLFLFLVILIEAVMIDVVVHRFWQKKNKCCNDYDKVG